MACPSCFGMMFRGTKFCPHCGAAAVEWLGHEEVMACPACQKPLLQGAVGAHILHQCSGCFGIWLDAATFERISADAAKEAAAVNGPGANGLGPAEPDPVRYRRCAVCQELMNRVNFGKCSRVIVDVCRAHGTWFDRDELQRIVLFIRSGGLERTREREMAEMAEQARRLESARRKAAAEGVWTEANAGRGDLLSVVVEATAQGLGNWLMR
jgi:Zn-finger nucleic acid-binding protein